MYCSRCGTWTPDLASECARCGQARTPQASATEGVEFVPSHAGGGPAPVAVPLAAAPHYAGFWRRAVAMFVDWLLLFFPGAMLQIGMGLPTVFTMHPLRDDQMARYMVVLAATTAVWWLYRGLMESSRWRGTLGQQLLGMRVEDGTGRRISFARASGRFFAQWLSVLLCGLGYLFNLWTPRRQTLHDMVSGCVLIVPERAPVAEDAVVTGQPS